MNVVAIIGLLKTFTHLETEQEIYDEIYFNKSIKVSNECTNTIVMYITVTDIARVYQV